MAESGVIYTCHDDFLEAVPSLMAQAGIGLESLPGPEFGEGCERSFALRMSCDKGTVELTGFYFVEEKRFILGFGWGRNPLRWSQDAKLSNVVKELLMDAGMFRVSTETVSGGEVRQGGESREENRGRSDIDKLGSPAGGTIG